MTEYAETSRLFGEWIAEGDDDPPTVISVGPKHFCIVSGAAVWELEGLDVTVSDTLAYLEGEHQFMETHVTLKLTPEDKLSVNWCDGATYDWNLIAVRRAVAGDSDHPPT